MPELSRRGFLTALSAAMAGSVLDPERLLWVPGRKTIFLPPAAGNTFVTAEWMSREVLRMLSNNLTFAASLNRVYDDNFMVGQTVTARLPQRFAAG